MNLGQFCPRVFLGIMAHISTVRWSGTEGPSPLLGSLSNIFLRVYLEIQLLSWSKSFHNPCSKEFGLSI